MLSRYHIDVIWKLHILNKFINFSNHDTVLDAGCGDGFIGSQIAKNVRNLVGADWDLDRIELNRKYYKNENISFINIHLGDFNTGKDAGKVKSLKFTKIVNLSALEHMENPQQVLCNFASLLEKDGQLLVLVPLGPGNGCEITKELVVSAIEENLHVEKADLIRAKSVIASLRKIIIYFQSLFGFSPEPEENRFSSNISYSMEGKFSLVVEIYKFLAMFFLTPIIRLHGQNAYFESTSLDGLNNPDFMQRPILVVLAKKK